MKSTHLILATTLLLGAVLPAQAADADHITVENPRARAVPPTARNSGAFMQLRNDSDQPIRLINAESDVSNITELHTHIHDKGVMRMRRVDAIEVPAHGSVKLEPGGYHVMLIDLKQPLKPGDTVRMELTFGDGSKKPIEFQAQRTGMGMGMPPMNGMSHQGHMSH